MRDVRSRLKNLRIRGFKVKASEGRYRVRGATYYTVKGLRVKGFRAKGFRVKGFRAKVLGLRALGLRAFGLRVLGFKAISATKP